MCTHIHTCINMYVYVYVCLYQCLRLCVLHTCKCAMSHISDARNIGSKQKYSPPLFIWPRLVTILSRTTCSRLHTHNYTLTCTYAHTHMHTHIHTHTHTHITLHTYTSHIHVHVYIHECRIKTYSCLHIRTSVSKRRAMRGDARRSIKRTHAYARACKFVHECVHIHTHQS